MKNATQRLEKILITALIVSLLPLQTLAFGMQNVHMGARPSSLLEGKKAGIDYQSNRIVVKYKNDKKPFQVISLPEGLSVEDAVKRYKTFADVAYAEPDYIAYADTVPTDPLYTYQWNMDNPTGSGIEIEEARNITTGSPDVIVAVIDTGVAYETATHSRKTYYRAPDLATTCFKPGYDYINNDAWANDDNGHGTHVTGTIAQSTNNGVGVAGVAPGTCIMPIKALDKSGSGSYTAIANSIRYAVDHGADVINMSLGGTASSSVLEEAVAYAYNHGVTIIAAAGNSNTNSPHYPSSYNDYVISVGATGYDKVRASYSNYGPDVDIAAPGGDFEDLNGDEYEDGILQNTFGDTLSTFGYYFYMGTSMASPHVAGVAALLIANGNATTPDDIRTALGSTAKNIGEQELGHGLVDAYAALNWTAEPVNDINNAPIANAGMDQTLTDTDKNGSEPVVLNGSASSDTDGTIMGYEWKQGATVIGTSPIASTTAFVGTTTYTLTVTDNEGAVSSDTVVVVIKAVPVVNISITGVTANNTYLGGQYLVRAYAKNDGASTQMVTFHLEIYPLGQPTSIVSWKGLTDQTTTLLSGASANKQWTNKVPRTAKRGWYTAHVVLKVGGDIIATQDKDFLIQ